MEKQFIFKKYEFLDKRQEKFSNKWFRMHKVILYWITGMFDSVITMQSLKNARVVSFSYKFKHFSIIYCSHISYQSEKNADVPLIHLSPLILILCFFNTTALQAFQIWAFLSSSTLKYHCTVYDLLSLQINTVCL